MNDALAGTGLFVRAFLRRDKIMIGWFALGITLLYWSQVASVRSLYSTHAELARAARSMGDNAAFVAMAGPARALDTEGGQVTWQASAFGAVVIGLMAMLLVTRHTRAEEESGRDELVRAAAVGRHAPQTAALVVTVIASLVVGACVAGSLVASGLPVAGSAANGVGVALSAWAFGAVTLLAAQLTSSPRATYGLTGAAIGIAYGLRAVGDVGNGAWSWLSPIGWYQAMHAFSGEVWWPALLLLGFAGALTATAYVVFGHRDIGSGVWPSRPGPARAPSSLQGPLGLAWRLQRASVVAWALGLFAGGLAYGSIGDDVEGLVGDSDFARDVFGSGGVDPVDNFYAASAVMLVLIAAGFAIASALRPRGEEDGGRVEALLATALPRRRWLVGHLVVTVVGTVVAVTLAGLGMGLGFALVTGDASRIGSFTWATVSLLPGVLLLGALTRLLFGLVPRAASLGWLGLAFCAVVMLFGTALRLPGWLQDLSPFRHLAAVPAAPVDWAAASIVLLVAVLFGAAGVLAFARRDVH